ncbi:MAG TPA: FeoB-associated Cys-rich membrane protein [Bacteroidales bacterium]|nr:FeoB-associated Cys-rich membrane protein [Bacteroidales bacterium]HOH21819.1 FeoB-associated Cys-rich membrane protein [Bacteroidales bacterium]HPB57151.1 FeoB-associated Cys-rich membrane protein [Bacteroidales bacterium]HPZ02715.1 FeoB-associated Cys-rich membrane protein [Bacteroidales bacterium]HQB74385.1 FeoB-associated Cys-rich membrane protein [Bacteroidales bacterium]
MIQNIIVAVVILLAVCYAIYKIVQSFKKKKDCSSGCVGCTGCELSKRNM